ncbi:calcium-binding protein [Pseudomonas mosselii]|uniref:Calcium-binding protein n=2 Tax=Pseudomonas mosselii TaxID=78327 RepID=A0A5R8ZBA4_9PSED|nr:calcium-binding protein [Pseudomonas mosselii]
MDMSTLDQNTDVLASGNVDGPGMTALSDNGYVLVWSADSATFEGVVVARYNADGTLLQRTDIASDDVDDPSVTALPNGQFILAWTSENDDTDTGYVYTQLFGASGSKIGSPVLVASAQYELEDAKVHVLSDTRYIVTWGETHSTGGELDPSTADIKAVVYTNGQPGSVQTLLTGDLNAGEADDVAIFSSSGNLWLTYSLQKTTYVDGSVQSSSSTLSIAQITSTGTAIPGTTQELAQVTSNYVNANAAYFNVVQTNTGFLVTWVDDSQAGLSRVIHTQQYDQQFQALGEASEVAAAGSVNGASAQALPDGGYLLAWNIYDPNGAGVYVQRFNADGSAADQTPILVGTTESGVILWDAPSVTVLGNGSLVVSWNTSDFSNSNEDGGSTVLHIQQVSAAGELFGSVDPGTPSETDSGSESVLETAQIDGNLADFTFATDSSGNLTVNGQQTTSLADIGAVQFDDAIVTLQTGRFANESGSVVSMEPASTALSNGGYVIAWQQGDNIRVQQYDQSQDLVSDTVLPGVTGANPVVAATNDGGYVVGWTATPYTQVLQAYDKNGVASGVPVTVETQDNDNPSVKIEDASITVLKNGTWVVTWSEEMRDYWMDQNGNQHVSEGGELFMQLINPTTHALIGKPVKVDNTVKDNAIYAVEPSVTTLSNGGFVVLWERETDATDNVDVYMQLYSAAGKPVGGNVRVNSTIAGEQYGAEVAVLGDGSYVVTWTSVQYDANENATSADVFMQRYSAAGKALGGETQVNVTSSEPQGEPAITALQGGGYVISWATSDEVAYDGTNNLYAQIYDKSGNKVGAPLHITSDDSNDMFPVIAATDDGGFIITWEVLSPQVNGQNATGDIYSQRFDANGNANQLIGDTGDNTLVWTGAGGVILSGEEGNDTLVGGAANDTLIGGAGDDILDGGLGADVLVGGKGNDTYIVDNANDQVIENADEGIDTVRSAVTWTLGANLENLTLTGSAAINGTGNAGDNVLIGNSAANILSGGAGNDTLDGGDGVDVLDGGLGDDTYVVDLVVEGTGSSATLKLQDTIIEKAKQGTDTLQLRMDDDAVRAFAGTASITLDANLENLDASGTGALNLTLVGNKSSNTLTGNSGDNILDGKNGGDRLVGGDGDDTYYIYSDKDVVVELNGEAGGIDTVRVVSYLKNSYTLANNVENAIVDSKAAFTLIGNTQANTLTGNAAANVLDGGAGADTLIGGKGNDTYIVDNIDDVVVEFANEGIDTVKASVDYTLGDNLENLVLLDGAVNGTGNDLKNSITGNNADNVLDGGKGVDTLTGGKGNDTYIVDLLIKGTGAKASVVLEDKIVEKPGEGTDTLQLRADADAFNGFQGSASITLGANLENLDARQLGNLSINLTGNAADNEIWGSDGNGVINGGAGNDILHAGDGGSVLIGGLGADVMYGGAGQDTFKFTNLKELGLGDKQDVIHDFGSGDTLDFSALKGYTFVGTDNFSGAKQLRYEVNDDGITVYGNSNANTAPDFSIKIVGVIDHLQADQLSL